MGVLEKQRHVEAACHQIVPKSNCNCLKSMLPFIHCFAETFIVAISICQSLQPCSSPHPQTSHYLLNSSRPASMLEQVCLSKSWQVSMEMRKSMFVQKVGQKTSIYNQMNQSICGNANGVCQSVTNIFEYSNIFDPSIDSGIRSYHFLDTNIFICSSCQLFGYKYIRIFVRSMIFIWIYSDIRSYKFSGHEQIQNMFLLIFSGYYTLLMDMLLISIIKNAI